jgi:hypothetical protein
LTTRGDIAGLTAMIEGSGRALSVGIYTTDAIGISSAWIRS